MVEESHLSARQASAKLGIPRTTVYRRLTAHDLISSPAFIVLKTANEFKDKTTAINQLWQTDFTYIKVIGWVVLRTHLSLK